MAVAVKGSQRLSLPMLSVESAADAADAVAARTGSTNASTKESISMRTFGETKFRDG